MREGEKEREREQGKVREWLRERESGVFHKYERKEIERKCVS